MSTKIKTSEYYAWVSQYSFQDLAAELFKFVEGQVWVYEEEGTLSINYFLWG